MIIQLLFFTSLSFFAHADIQRPPTCERFLVVQDPIMRMTAPLFEDLSMRWGRNMGQPVDSLIGEAREQRVEVMYELRAWAAQQNPILRKAILKDLNELKLPFMEMQVRYGGDTIPVIRGKNELSPKWKERMDQLADVSLNARQRGKVGEWVALLHLEDVVAYSVHPREILTDKERKASFLSNDPRYNFLSPGQRGEIDVIFQGGKAFAEIKFASIPMGDKSRAMDKFESQAERMALMMTVTAKLGNPRDGYFIFVGVGPTPTQTKILEELGLKSIRIPFIY